jgi:hypothetical protein
LKAQKSKLEKELEEMEAAEKKAVKTKKVSKVAEKIKAAKKSVAKKTPAKAPAKEERKKDNIARDGDRKSLPAGKRISKTGKVYYEMRANRTDKQTSKKPYLADGGKLPNGKYQYEKGDEGMFDGDEVRVTKYHVGYNHYEYDIIDENGKVIRHGGAANQKAFERRFRYFPKMANGGATEEGVDLFEDYDNIPTNVQEVLDKYSDAFEDGDYRKLEKANNELKKIGYTFEYGLDGEAYDLRKIGQKGKMDEDEYANGGEVSKKYVVFFTRFNNGKSVPRVVEMYDNESDAKEYVESQKKLGEKGFKIKQAKDMPIYSMINIVDKSKYKELKDLIHSKDKVDAFFDGKDSFYKKDYGWVKPYGYVWENWKLVSAPNETMAKGGAVKKAPMIYEFKAILRDEDDKIIEKKEFKVRATARDSAYNKAYKKYPRPYFVELYNSYSADKMADGGDIYDDMEEDIYFANDKAKKIVNSLESLGYKVVKLHEADYDTDAQIDLSEKVNIQVGLEGDLSIVIEKEEGKFTYIDCGKSYATLLIKLSNIDKQYMEKGGKTKRTVKLTLSDKDSYDYTYKQDGATASITFGFGKEPFQYEVKKISKSLEPLQQDILDTFTLQGIKQHEYKGGFSEAIKHLDTAILENADEFAKGGVIKISLSDIEGADFQSLSQIFESNDTDFSVDEDEEFVLMDLKGLPDGEDKETAMGIIGKYKVRKMADGGKLKIGDIVIIKNPLPEEDPNQLYVVIQEDIEKFSDDEQIDIQVLNEDNYWNFPPIVRVEKKDLEIVYDVESYKKMADGGKTDEDIDLQIEKDMNSAIKKRDEYQSELKKLLDEKSQDSGHIEYLSYEIESLNKLAKKLHDVRLKRLRDKALPKGNPFKKMAHGGNLKVGKKIKYEGKEGKIISKKGDMYFIEVEKYHPNGDTLRTVIRENEIDKMADGGYVVFEGRDNYNDKPLYKVISKDEDNDYDGEFHDNREDAEKELKELKNKDMNYAKGGNTDTLYTKLVEEHSKGGYERMGVGFDRFLKMKMESASAKGNMDMYYKLMDVEQMYENDFYAKGGYMADGGKVPAHFGSGRNINVFGYQTENFDICGTAVKEFEAAVEIMQNAKESEKESLARCAKYVDGLFGIEKLVVETSGADDANFYEAVSDIMSASIYNYRAEMSINLFSFVPQHLKEIAVRMAKADKGGLYALGGMTAGRWYRDKSGEEFKFIGKIDSGENKGKFLFTDGQKSVYKDLEDFEGGRPKETKLFGFFEDGGSVAEGNYEMLMSNIKAIKHHAEELEGAVTPNTEIEAWVLSKSERAETDLSDITHYLDGLKMAKGGYMADGGKVDSMKKEWSDFVKSNVGYFQINRETDDMIHLNTREHGSIGDEEYGQEDADYARYIIKKVREKYPKTKSKLYSIDEWVELELTYVEDESKKPKRVNKKKYYQDFQKYVIKNLNGQKVNGWDFYYGSSDGIMSFQKDDVQIKATPFWDNKEILPFDVFKNDGDDLIFDVVYEFQPTYNLEKDFKEYKSLVSNFISIGSGRNFEKGGYMADGGKVDVKDLTYPKYEVSKPEFEAGFGKGKFKFPDKWEVGGFRFDKEKDANAFYDKLKGIDNMSDYLEINTIKMQDFFDKKYQPSEYKEPKVGSPYPFSAFQKAKHKQQFQFLEVKGGEEYTIDFVLDKVVLDKALGWRKFGNEWIYGDYIYDFEGYASVGSGAIKLILVKTMEKGGYMAKGGNTNYTKTWKVVGRTMQGKLFEKEITLGRMSDRNDVMNALKRMPDTQIREITFIGERFKAADGGMMAKGGTLEMEEFYLYDENGKKYEFYKKEGNKYMFSSYKVPFGKALTIEKSELQEKIKDGKYKVVASHAKGGDLSSIKKKYEENEDENAHSENVVLLAKHFGTKEDLAKAKEILALHEKEGSLSSENGKKRQELHLKLIDKARAEMGKQGIEFEKGGYMASGAVIPKGARVGMKIKDWYIKNYPTDELGEEINDTMTFKGFWALTGQGNNPYEVLGVHDSVVRERVEEKLSQILGKKEMADGGMMNDGVKIKVGDEVELQNGVKAKVTKLRAIGRGGDRYFVVKLPEKYGSQLITVYKKDVVKLASGGKVKFADKVKSVQESLLKRKKVSPKVQKDYGKTYSKAEAKESAQRIVGSRMAQLKEKMAKKKK